MEQEIERNTQKLFLSLLIADSAETMLRASMQICTESTCEIIFQALTGLIEQGRSKFRTVAYESSDHGQDYTEYLKKTFIHASYIWPFAKWVPNNVTLSSIEELELQIKGLYPLLLAEYVNQRRPKDGEEFSIISSGPPFEAAPEWLTSISPLITQKETVSPFENLPEELTLLPTDSSLKIEMSEISLESQKALITQELFKNSGDIEKYITALRLIRPHRPIISEARRWQDRTGGKKVLAAWVRWLEDCDKIHFVRPIDQIVPLLNNLFPGLNLGQYARTLKDPDDAIVTEFIKLSELLN